MSSVIGNRLSIMVGMSEEYFYSSTNSKYLLATIIKSKSSTYIIDVEFVNIVIIVNEVAAFAHH